MRPLIVGNWKMNGLSSQMDEIKTLAKFAKRHARNLDIVICVPATLLQRVFHAAAGAVAMGGQDCHSERSGPYTGDISADMLKDAGASAVIVGHSERRRLHGETDGQIAAKARAAGRAGLLAIICVGETETQRLDGKALRVCAGQVTGSVPDTASNTSIAVAYEPVWAIGGGPVPTAREISRMHAEIRHALVLKLGAEGQRVPILYGGSVDTTNVEEILRQPDVNGVLIGRASLETRDFEGIIRAASRDVEVRTLATHR